MNNCTKARFELAFVRLLALVGTGVATWYVAGALAQYFHYDLNNLLQVGLGAASGIAAWFASKGLLDFTGDCLDVPTMATGLHNEPVHAHKANCGKVGCPVPKNAKSVAATGKSATSKSGPGRSDRSAGATSSGTIAPAPLTMGSVLKTAKLAIDTAAIAEGGIKVTVTVSGLSASQFKGNNGNNGFRGRVENVSGIKWSKPVNLHDGRRQMEGTIADTTKAEESLGRLKAAVERFQ